MKKLISVFAALALVGSLAAQKGKKPAAKAPAAPAIAAPKAPAMPAVTAPTASSVAMAGSAMGLRLGLHVGYVTDMFKQGDNLKKWAGVAGGNAVKTAEANKSGSANCAAGATATCSGTGDGSNVSLNGLDFGLKAEFDITSWLFIRSGFTYTMALKNTYTVSQTSVVGAANLTNNVTFTATGNSMEIPLMLGFNLIQNDKSAFYFAAGVAYVSGTYETTLSASQSGTTTATFGSVDGRTWTGVDNTTKQSGLGIAWLVGGRHKIAGGVALFGEVKFLSAAAAKEGAVTGTAFNTTTGTTAGTVGGYATSNPLYTAISAAAGGGVAGGSTINGATTTSYNANSQTGVGGLDLSYTRWQVGVQYEL